MRPEPSGSTRTLRAGSMEHPLGVVAGGIALDDCRRALRAEAGQEQARLHLCARDRHLVLDAHQGCAADLQRRQPLFPRRDVRSHLAQGLGDPVNRTAADRLVAVEAPGPLGLPGEPPRQESHQGAGVADVDLDRLSRPAAWRGRPARCPRPRRRAIRCGPCCRLDAGAERVRQRRASSGCRPSRGSTRSARFRPPSPPRARRGARSTCRAAA